MSFKTDGRCLIEGFSIEGFSIEVYLELHFGINKGSICISHETTLIKIGIVAYLQEKI